MVDTKDNSNENPTPKFAYEKDGEKIEVDANTFSADGQAIYLDLLQDREDEAQIRKIIRRNTVKLGDLMDGVAKRSNWLIENEINKPDEVAEAETVIEDKEGVEVVDESGEETKQ